MKGEKGRENFGVWQLEMALRVRPTLRDTELVDIFMGTLQKKEWEMYVVSTSIPQYQALMALMPYLPYPYVAAT